MVRCAVLAALALGLASCLVPDNAVVHDPGVHDPIEGVEPGQTMDDVSRTLGWPNARATGWWSSANRFDPNYVVWYYIEKGRVVFDGPVSRKVVVSEADPQEDGRP